ARRGSPLRGSAHRGCGMRRARLRGRLVLADDQVAAGGDDDQYEQADEPELARTQRRVHGLPIGRPGAAGLPEKGDTWELSAKREGAVSRALCNRVELQPVVTRSRRRP